ncbi:hypothetical protein GCM10023321_70210 [Pseudonocardia eucalypti]|uniref:Uncharacterized protein n=1 Tax=Pseudonocardia eucalypti TaxID=648755 RepID=A0ABP9R526_9PSEU
MLIDDQDDVPRDLAVGLAALPVLIHLVDGGAQPLELLPAEIVDVLDPHGLQVLILHSLQTGDSLGGELGAAIGRSRAGRQRPAFAVQRQAALIKCLGQGRAVRGGRILGGLEVGRSSRDIEVGVPGGGQWQVAQLAVGVA